MKKISVIIFLLFFSYISFSNNFFLVSLASSEKIKKTSIENLIKKSKNKDFNNILAFELEEESNFKDNELNYQKIDLTFKDDKFKYKIFVFKSIELNFLSIYLVDKKLEYRDNNCDGILDRVEMNEKEITLSKKNQLEFDNIVKLLLSIQKT